MVYAWHFAHVSRGVYEDTKGSCSFSFFVSVRMMARQIVGDSLDIRIPPYGGKVSGVVESTGEWLEVSFPVAKAQRLQLECIQVETALNGVTVDVLGEVMGVPFALFFTHPGREVPAELSENFQARCGVVAVALDGLAPLFTESGTAGDSYTHILKSYLADDSVCKSWIYHPRYDSCHELAQQELANSIEHENQLADQLAANAERVASALMECVLCKTTWTGHADTQRTCPECLTHLYTKITRV